jgi:drug/metabolite transporter (DMT)-like permease
MSERGDARAIVLAFAGIYVIWGTTFLAIALMIRTIPPFLGGALRYFIAGGLMFVWLRLREPRPFTGLAIGGSLLCGVLLSGIGNGFVIWAQQGLPSGVTALFISALPVTMLLLDWLFFSHTAPTPRGLAGLAIGFAGVVILALHTHSLSGQVRTIHVVAVLTAELGWALGSLLQRAVAPPNRLAAYSCLQMLAGSGFQLLMALLDREWVGFTPSRFSLQSLLAMGYLVVFGSIIAVNCYSYLLAHVPAQKVSTYALVNPIIALGLGAVVLHERITPLSALCATLVIVGVALVLWRGRPVACRNPPRLV